ncbi:helix-turn-helix transcriptional regulator [Patescibacteria group bacterium]|nr:helix-turn-helix transcriptional regulator [Patescibacteria group bacterium]
MLNKKQIKKELKDSKALLQCAEQFGLVGDPTRMKICWVLCKHKELSVGEIAELLDVSVSVVSHSLKRLRKHKLVKSRRDYKQVFYSFSDTSFNKVLKNTLTNL